MTHAMPSIWGTASASMRDTITVFALAPIVGLLLGLSSNTVPRTTLFLSVVL
jgi:hypothetical protein